MNKISRFFRVFVPGLLLVLYSIDSAQAAHSQEPSGYFSDFAIILLSLLCLLQLLAFAFVFTDRRRLRCREQQLKTQYEQLEKRLLERSQKLHNINNQLYEEIAKHEITEELVRQTQEYIQNIINSMPSILIGVTREGIITHWNTAARTTTGVHYEQALGYSINRVAPELNIDESLINKAIDLQKTQKLENRQQGHGSQATYSDLTVYPLLSSDIDGAVIRIDDVTLRVRLETMMIQSEKMNSLGELAAGVAHEINNPLGTILQSIQNIKRRFSMELPANQSTAQELGLSMDSINDYVNSRRIFDFLEDIKAAGERATVIVSNMLEFSRAQDIHFDEIDITELLDRAIDLALSAISATHATSQPEVIVERQYPKNNRPVLCSPVEIQQVILNLLSNAHHAFGEPTTDAPLRIEVILSFDETHAIIEIGDNGPGMDAWTCKHIFDPFFTTKEVGKGTGLGLSVSYFIITEHHQGSITVDSKLGVGTRFTIQLPLPGTCRI